MASTRVLLVLGEILSEDNRNDLLPDIIEGFTTVPNEAFQCIQEVSNLACASEVTTTDGGILLQRVSAGLEIFLAFRPSPQGLASAIAKVLKPPLKPEDNVNTVLIYTGLLAEGSGHWLLPEYVFTPELLTDQIEQVIASYNKPIDIEKQSTYKRILLHIGIGSIGSGGEWRQLVTRHFDAIGGHSIQVSVNSHYPLLSKQKSTAVENSFQSDFTPIKHIVTSMLTELPDPYCAHLHTTLTRRACTDPTLRVSGTSLYIFPEGSGQSTILTLPGYSMLIDLGCSHRPKFWPVANHLDRLDSVFITHWGIDNLLGMKAVLPVVFASNQSGLDEQRSMTCLLTPPPNPANVHQFNEPNTRSPFYLSLPRSTSALISDLKQTGCHLVAYPLSRGGKLDAPATALQLYKKVGQGSLDMYVLTPSDDDSAELRRLTDDWSKASPGLMNTTVPLGKTPLGNKYSIPLLSHLSVSALVIWRPARESDPILRILFVSSNAHQARILISLDAVVGSNICLRHAKAVPTECERKRPPNPAPRRTHMPSAISIKSVSASGTNSIEVKPPTKMPQGHTSTKKEEKTTTKTPSFAPRPMSLKTDSATTASNIGLIKTSETTLSSTEPNPKPPTMCEDVPLVKNGDKNGYRTTAFSANNPSAGIPALSSSLDNLDVSLPGSPNHHTEQDFSPTQNMKPQSGDVISSWGMPQGLPPPGPPIGPPSNVKTGPVTKQIPSKRLTSRPSAPIRTTRTTEPTATISYPPGFTDASAHALGTGSIKLHPYDKVKPLYVDVSFLPGGGNPHLVDAEWFKRVRARYYVVTHPKPSAALMDAIAVGKESWTGEDSKLLASIVFAHESEELMIWLGKNAGRLAACQLDAAAIASRSSIKLLSTPSTEPLNCAGYRIDL